MSPAASRDCVSVSIRASSAAASCASLSRSAARLASAYAVRTATTRSRPACTSRSAAASSASRAAATRRGRSHSTSIGQRSVASSCLGPMGNSSESTGLVKTPASTRSARAKPRSITLTWKAALFHSARATASSAVSPSSTCTPGGADAAPAPSRRASAPGTRPQRRRRGLPQVGLPRGARAGGDNRDGDRQTPRCTGPHPPESIAPRA